ncbi:MAG: response regulator [Deltaproteobacteria bacterium]|nr:response regulator [Deltaproteobacteria bacterium]
MSEDSELTKVLVVDDDTAVRETLKDVFKKKGFFVATAGTGAEALEQIKKTPFHFAVIDIRLPDMSGNDLLKEIHKTNFKINCIMITGYSEELAQTNLQGDEATARFMKPLKLDELIAIFEKK